jgi:GxxExxY protein
LEPVTERIIGCAFRVANALGHGFVEKVYENALAHEIRKCGLGAVQQRGIVVFYDDVIVGEFTAGLLAEDQVIVEPEVAGTLSDVHVPQCRNYLRATGKPLCLLISFGQSKVEIRCIAPSFACSATSLACSLRPSLIAKTTPLIPTYPANPP